MNTGSNETLIADDHHDDKAYYYYGLCVLDMLDRQQAPESVHSLNLRQSVYTLMSNYTMRGSDFVKHMRDVDDYFGHNAGRNLIVMVQVLYSCAVNHLYYPELSDFETSEFEAITNSAA